MTEQERLVSDLRTENEKSNRSIQVGMEKVAT